jgi:GWxTD domain-containing protein
MPFYRKTILIVSAVLSMISGSCVSPEIAAEKASQGANYFFRPGYPEIRMAAVGTYDDSGIPGINVIIDVVYGSLIYTETENNFVANIGVEIRMIELTQEPYKTYVRNFDVEVTKVSRQVTTSQESFNASRRVPIRPGNYRVIVAVTDEKSKKVSVAETQTFVPNPTQRVVNLTEILIFGKEANEEYRAVPTYDIRGRLDSLKFVYQLNKPVTDANSVLESRLISYPSDTTAARFVTMPNPRSGITYNGIDYDRGEVLNLTRRRLFQSEGNITFEFPYTMLGPGNYRFEVQLVQGDSVVASRARDFGVKNAYYPTLRMVRELAEPLVYLMGDREYKELLALSTPDSMKIAMDSFWLKNIRNPRLAANVVELFYSRVEEANKRFSCYKEGWKTDMGMIFIVFGPPWQVEQEFQTMTWYYGMQNNGPALQFSFEELRPPGKKHAFQVYQLNRRNYYGQLYNNKVANWLDGSILTRDS